MRLGVCILALVLMCNLPAHAQNQRSRAGERSGNPSGYNQALDGNPFAWSAWPGVAPPARSSAPGEPVSVEQLKIPARALKEIQISKKFYEAGKFRNSAEHLERALQADPEFALAHYSLGLCYVRLDEFDRAISEFQRTSGLDPHLVQPFVALSGSLFVQKRYAEAEAAARHAIEIEPANREARYLVGRSLAAENQNTAEAVELLRQSRDEFPLARVVLAGVLLNRRQRDEAIAELQAYAQRPNAELRDRVNCMLAKLEQRSDQPGCAAD